MFCEWQTAFQTAVSFERGKQIDVSMKSTLDFHIIVGHMSARATAITYSILIHDSIYAIKTSQSKIYRKKN